jgi:type II protein arginine methyltransferase
MDKLKKKFRDGHHAEAIAECEALCQAEPENREIRRLCAMMHALAEGHGRALELLLALHAGDPTDADLLFNIALCESKLKDFAAARQHFELYTRKFATHADGWVGIAECYLELGMPSEAVSAADRAIKLDGASASGWVARGNGQKALGRFEDALGSYRRANQARPTVEGWTKSGQLLFDMYRPLDGIECFSQAIKLAPKLADARVLRGDAFARLGRLDEAVADFRTALSLSPDNAETLKKACLSLLAQHKGREAIELCDDTLKTDTSLPAIRIVREWVLNQLVPSWHVPMMNEPQRNQAYCDALASVVSADKVVFEIGTGSGLLAMMAARLGARQVYTCEAIDLIADTARKIVRRNGYEDRVLVIGKHSNSVRLGDDMPARADILVHEIFSSDLLGEHLLSALEDAKRRLLKPDAKVLPAAGSIMIALVGGEELGRHVFVDRAFGFDLSDFNRISGRREPLFRQDLEIAMMSMDVEAFRFDFQQQTVFPAQTRALELTSNTSGTCYGVIQWIRVELNDSLRFENHPRRQHAVANWQHIVHRFDQPINLEPGQVVSLNAGRNRVHPWFELVAMPSRNSTYDD